MVLCDDPSGINRMSENNRKLRTRTLIQLGALIEKSGLVNFFNIELGKDLQLDKEEAKKAAALLGFLLQSVPIAKDENHTKHEEWRNTGTKVLNPK